MIKMKNIQLKKNKEDILYCDNCGAETKESDRTCPGCGITFEE